MKVENKSEINWRGGYFCTPLHYACENENVTFEIIKYMVEKKTNLNLKNSYSKNVVQCAKENPSLILKIEEKFGKNIDLIQLFKSFQK